MLEGLLVLPKGRRAKKLEYGLFEDGGEQEKNCEGRANKEGVTEKQQQRQCSLLFSSVEVDAENRVLFKRSEVFAEASSKFNRFREKARATCAGTRLPTTTKEQGAFEKLCRALGEAFGDDSGLDDDKEDVLAEKRTIISDHGRGEQRKGVGAAPGSTFARDGAVGEDAIAEAPMSPVAEKNDGSVGDEEFIGEKQSWKQSVDNTPTITFADTDKGFATPNLQTKKNRSVPEKTRKAQGTLPTFTGLSLSKHESSLDALIPHLNAAVFDPTQQLLLKQSLGGSSSAGGHKNLYPGGPQSSTAEVLQGEYKQFLFYEHQTRGNGKDANIFVEAHELCTLEPTEPTQKETQVSSSLSENKQWDSLFTQVDGENEFFVSGTAAEAHGVMMEDAPADSEKSGSQSCVFSDVSECEDRPSELILSPEMDYRSNNHTRTSVMLTGEKATSCQQCPNVEYNSDNETSLRELAFPSREIVVRHFEKRNKAVHGEAFQAVSEECCDGCYSNFQLQDLQEPEQGNIIVQSQEVVLEGRMQQCGTAAFGICSSGGTITKTKGEGEPRIVAAPQKNDLLVTEPIKRTEVVVGLRFASGLESGRPIVIGETEREAELPSASGLVPVHHVLVEDEEDDEDIPVVPLRQSPLSPRDVCFPAIALDRTNKQIEPFDFLRAKTHQSEQAPGDFEEVIMSHNISDNATFFAALRGVAGKGVNSAYGPSSASATSSSSQKLTCTPPTRKRRASKAGLVDPAVSGEHFPHSQTSSPASFSIGGAASDAVSIYDINAPNSGQMSAVDSAPSPSNTTSSQGIKQEVKDSETQYGGVYEHREESCTSSLQHDPSSTLNSLTRPVFAFGKRPHGDSLWMTERELKGPWYEIPKLTYSDIVNRNKSLESPMTRESRVAFLVIGFSSVQFSTLYV
ncbi:unnamed protein product [Amoebophrya sp. A25]|nr:unnamed protein product [Amoebophrya sp. A25]|eukprot:GSA25T00026927001.1